MIALSHAELAALHTTIHEQAELISLQGDKIKLLEEKVHVLTARRFGASSERIHPDQGTLFSNNAEVDASNDGDPETFLVPAHRRKKRRDNHGRELFPEHLPRNHIVIDPEEHDRTCLCCGDPLICIRREITERGDVIPTQILVNHYDRGVWACRNGDSAPKIGALPLSVVNKAKWEPSAYAHLVTSKYADHLPLHRMMGIFKRHGIHFSKSTMWGLLKDASDLLAAVIDQMRRELLQIRLLQADETPIRVMMPTEDGSKKKRKVQTGYMWVYGAFDEGKVLFDFTTNRSRAGPREFLGDWTGTLVVDEYAGYNEVCETNAIARGACWSHARRRMDEALKCRTRQAVQAMALITWLFRLEEAYERHLGRHARRVQARGEEPLDLEGKSSIRLAARQRFSKSVIVQLARLYRSWKRDPSVIPKSLLAKAVGYVIKNAKTFKHFTLFLKDGRVPLHNNGSENAIRPVAVGRKNWLVAGSAAGGDTGAILYSLMASCKAVGVNPEQYLCDVLSRIRLEIDVKSLTPWGWQAERERREAKASAD